MAEEHTTSEPTSPDPAVSVVGPGQGEMIALGSTRTMSRYATVLATEFH